MSITQTHKVADANRDQAIVNIVEQLRDGEWLVDIKKPNNTRTSLQNRAIHKYFSDLSTALNDAGHSVQVVLAQAVDREFDAPTVKSQIWKPVQIAMTGNESTSKALTHDYGKVYETVNRFMAEKFGVYVPFPSIQELSNERIAQERL